jgi:hypothetical protein
MPWIDDSRTARLDFSVAPARMGKSPARGLEETVKGLVAFVLFTQLMAAAAVLAAAKLRQALGAPDVRPKQFLLIAVQMWLPTAVTFVFMMNVALEKWELRPLLAIPVLLLALLVPGVAIAGLLLRRASRHAGQSVTIAA